MAKRVNMRPSNFLAAVVGLALTAAIGSAHGPGQTQNLPGSVIPAVSRSKDLGPAPGSQVFGIVVGLQPRYPDELRAFCDAVSDPRSPNYRQFISPSLVGENFGASPADVDAVVRFLRSQGMRITLIAKNRMAVCATTTVSLAQAAFGTTIRRFAGTDSSGKAITFRANSTPVKLPANIARFATGVSGIQTYARPHARATFLNPTLTRGLYNTAPTYASGNKGQGRTIAFTNFAGLNLANVPLYITDWSLPVPAGGAGSNISIVTWGSPGNTAPEDPEADLDLQMELGMAPLANIIVYDNDAADYIGLTTKEANDNLADVISESYGWSGFSLADLTALHNQHLSMTAQGMTYCSASGDRAIDSAVVEGYWPNIDPEILMVGGTCANADGATGARIGEDGWGQYDPLQPTNYGSGGGWVDFSLPPWNDPTFVVSFNTLPPWQRGNGGSYLP